MGSGKPKQLGVAKELEERGVVGRVLNIDLEQPGAADAVDDKTHREGREDGGHDGIGNENAADQSGEDRECGAEEDGPAERHMLMGRKREDPGDGYDHGRDHRQIDAAPDYDQPHAESEDPQDRDAADERDQITGREKVVQREREDDEQDRSKRENDAFLRDAQLAKI